MAHLTLLIVNANQIKDLERFDMGAVRQIIDLDEHRIKVRSTNVRRHLSRGQPAQGLFRVAINAAHRLVKGKLPEHLLQIII